MSLDSVVSITISTQSKTPTQRGFGTPLVMAYHTLDVVTRVRTYTALADMVADGFSIQSGAYKASLAIKSQSPSVPEWKIGRRGLVFTQIIELTVTSAVAGVLYFISVTTNDGVKHDLTYTVPSSGSPTTSTVATAIAALIDALANVSAAAVAAVITCTTGTAGMLLDYSTFNRELHLVDKTLDPGIVTDFTACQLEDGDFYGVCLDSNSAAEITSLAATIETNIAIFAPNTADFGPRTSGSTTDIASVLKGFSYQRSILQYNGRNVLSFIGAGALGGRLSDAPGSSTWAHKTIAGVTKDQLNATEITQLESRNCNYYVDLAGSGNTFWGLTPGGEYIDITIFVDWLRVRMQERIVGVLQNVKKIPFTDNGINTIVGQVKAQLQDGIDAGGLAADPAPVVTAPLAKDVSTANKANRVLPDVNFAATLAGAIHQVEITGVVSV